MKVALTLLFFCVIGPLYACVCFDIDSASAKELMDEVEFVIVGCAVKNAGYNEEVNTMWDQEGRGYDVIFQIDSVVKGQIDGKFVYIKQFNGNCDRIFEFGEQYLMVGNAIDKFVQGDQKRRKSNKEGIPITDVPPPPPSIDSKTVTFYDRDRKEIEYWNELVDDGLILNTSSCSSFSVNSEVAGYFLSN